MNWRGLSAHIAALTVLVWAQAAIGQGEIRVKQMSDWTIVVASDVIPSERYAAQEFQRFFAQATGIHMSIEEQSDSGHGQVLIGPGAVSQAGGMAFLTEDFGPEDARVVVRPDGIAIAGGRPRGTLYGVCTFLEDALGIRFLTPDHTHVPTVPEGGMLQAMDKTFRPPLKFRWSYFGEIAKDHVFATRMRSNTVQDEEHLGGKTPIVLVNHTFAHLMPWAQYGEQHPEYYDEVEGERPKDIWNDQYDPGVQLCTTHPEVKRIVTEEVLKGLAANPHQGNISVSQNDNNRRCTCTMCRAVDEVEGSSMGSLLSLVNTVAEGVEKEYPNVLVGTLAYNYSRKPPRSIRPRDNVQIQLANIECCQKHAISDQRCPRNRAFCEDLRGWGEVSDNIYVWTYVTNFHNYLIPCPNLRAVGENIRFFHENGVKGLFMQGPAEGAELAGLRNYVISNMIWDPTRHEDDLMAEFLQLHYRSAAPLIREYIDMIHAAALASPDHPGCYGSAADHGFSQDVGYRGLEIFERAMELADDDTIRQRVEKASIACHAIIVDLVVGPAFQKVRSQKKRRDETPFEIAPSLAASMRPHLVRFLELCAKHQIPRVGEWASVEEVVEVLREGYGLVAGEDFL
jgi:hypothetical protein